MKTKLLLFLTTIAIFTFASCEKHGHHEPKKNCEETACENPIKATIRYNLCGIGVWGDYVLELEDGTIVQPWSAATDAAKNFEPKADMTVWVAFEETSKDNRYDNIIRCKALGEYETRISKVVNIKCITPEDKKDCTTIATVRHNICGVGLWGALVLELENGDIVQPWSASDSSIAKLKLSPDQKIKIGFTEVKKDNRYDNVITCAAIGQYAEKIKSAVNINCVTVVNQPIDDKIYTVNATVVDFNCAAAGIWGGIQFKTDAIHLQPWTIVPTFKATDYKLSDKQKVKITYSQVAYDDRYKDTKICPTFVALPKAIAIKVHEIQIINND